MTTPTILCERLTLVPYLAGHVTDEHVAWLNDPEVVKYSEQRHKKHTLESQHAYVNKMNHSEETKIWAILCSTKPNSEGSTIGTITAYIDQHNKVAEVGIMIGDKASWGKGYGTEAFKAVCDWLAAKGMRKIEAGLMSSNLAMQKVCLNSGMVLEGEKADHFLLNGAPEDVLLFGRWP